MFLSKSGIIFFAISVFVWVVDSLVPSLFLILVKLLSEELKGIEIDFDEHESDSIDSSGKAVEVLTKISIELLTLRADLVFHNVTENHPKKVC